MYQYLINKYYSQRYNFKDELSKLSKAMKETYITENDYKMKNY
jgi:hypothetical protein